MTIDMEKVVNPRVRAATEYNMQHFTAAWQQAEELSRAMANEFPYPPLKSVQAAIRDIVTKANWYPEDASGCIALREKLAAYTGLQPENVTFGNGSMELMDILFLTFIAAPNVDEVVTISPDYTPYEVRPSVFGAVVRNRIVGEDTDKAADAILELITPQTRLILFSRPNNPTGKVMSREDVIRILRSGVPTAVDEAYVELADGDTSIATLVSEWDNLIVLRTFSKGFGLAGLRFGYLLASPGIIHYANLARHVLNVNIVALVAASAALDDLENARVNMEKLRGTRQWLFEELKTIKGLRPILSQGNFILIDASGSGTKASDIVQEMFKRGIQLRDFSKKKGLPPDKYFRITVGCREGMKQVVEELRDLLS